MSPRCRPVLLPGLLAASVLLLPGATCLPLINLDGQPRGAEPAHRLAISVLQPDADREVPAGTIIQVRWTAVNLTGQEAIATVLLRDRSDLSETVLAGGIRVDTSAPGQSVDWDTTDFAGGQYSVVVRIEAGTQTAEDVSAGRIRVNTPPSLEFTDPFEDVVFGADSDPNAAPMLTIRWSAVDPEGQATADLGLDPDGDHESGNEVMLAQRDLPTTSGFDTLDWDGNDQNGDPVPPGTYVLFARLDDGLNPVTFVEAEGRITVPEPNEPNEPNTPAIALEITAPTGDSEFLTTDNPLTITYTLDEPNRVLVSLRVDPDDNHQNGNEITILSQRLIDPNTTEDSFDWDGTDSDGNSVPDGIYRLLLMVSRTQGSPEIVESSGLVFRRSSAGQPLIALLEPATDQNVGNGSFLKVRWRDEDPNGAATIRLTIDDDRIPNETTETDGDEREILSGREAAGDGVLDIFDLQIPADLAPGTYFLFAYIDRDDSPPFDNVSVAAGRIIVPDPSQ